MNFTTRSNLNGTCGLAHKSIAAAVKHALSNGRDWVERSIPGVFQAEDLAAISKLKNVRVVRVQINGCVVDRLYVRTVYIPRSIIVK